MNATISTIASGIRRNAADRDHVIVPVLTGE